MKILIIGTVIFTEKMLEKIISCQAGLVGVVTSENNKLNSDFVDLAPVCDEYKIPLFRTSDINDADTTTWIRKQEPDVIFCLGWSQIIKPFLINLPPKGIIGYHPAALPRNRGRHPIIWALVLGLEETASTFFTMNDKADSGDIVSQEKISIDVSDDAQSLYHKVVDVAGEQILKLVDDLQCGTVHAIPQDDAESNVWRRRNISDGIIDWRMSDGSINNLVRGLSKPYVGAEFEYLGVCHKLWRTQIVTLDNVENAEPGKVIAKGENGYIVRCGEGCIELCDIEPHIVLQEGDYL